MISYKDSSSSKVKVDRRTIAPILSLDFGIQVLNLEEDLQNNPSTVTVHELVNLYSQAIEFYEYNNDPRFLDYQKKLQTMLVQPEIISIMQTDSTVRRRRLTREFSAPSAVNFEVLKIKRKETSEVMRVGLISELNRTNEVSANDRNVQRREVNRIERDKKVSSKVLGDFHSQDMDLSKRMESRKKVKFNKSSISRSPESSTSNLDHSLDISEVVNAGFDSTKASFVGLGLEDLEIESHINDFEREIEAILEKSSSEEARIISEIKIKYKTQLKVLGEFGALSKAQKNELKEKVKSEVKSTVKLFADKRKEQIKILKEKYRNKYCI